MRALLAVPSSSSLGTACTAHSQQENQFISVPDEIVDQCSPKLRAMMGYKPFGGLGMNNGFSSRSSSRRQQVPGKTFVLLYYGAFEDNR